MLNISGYEILEKIGEGGMSTVWKARQLSLDRIVAIKVLSQTSLPDAEARAIFRREAQNTARLSHPNIVQIIDTGETGDDAYLVMEYVHGHTVGDEILRNQTLPEARALEITELVARALAYAWEKECLIHCDIKPDNLLVDSASGQIKVADLGLARMIGLRRATSDDDMIIGTANYTSPEQSASVPDLDCRTDMYALGATLYHMVTGTLPFRGATGSEAMTRHEQDYLEDPCVVNPSLSHQTAWFIEKLMIKNRALRSHFWTQTLKDIEAVRKGHMPFDPLPEPGASTVQRSPERVIVREKHTVVVPRKTSVEPPKLVLKKMPVSPMPAPAHAGPSAIGKFFRLVFVLFLCAVAAVLHLAHRGYLVIPGLPIGPRHEFIGDQPEPPPQADLPDEAAPSPPPPERPTVWNNEDFKSGARLFNQALADYQTYQQTRENPDVLISVEENCRLAIEHFEAARADAPAHINIGQYIDQCYGMISNVRLSSNLGMTPSEAVPGEQESTPGKPKILIETVDRSPALPAPTSSVGSHQAAAASAITFIDDEEEPATDESAPPEDTRELLRLAVGPAWNKPAPDAGGFADELRRLLTRHAEPSGDLQVDSSVVLYPGITCMMTARDAARVLNQELPMRRELATPGFPVGSFFYYTFTGDFAGATRLVLVVDRNARVVMSQLNDDRPAPARMEPALFSPNWKVVDFINIRRRADDEGLVAHRVRLAGNLIRLQTELAATAPGPNGERMASMRIQLNFPRELAALILHIGQ